MIETFDQHWPAKIPLLLYAEGFEPEPRPARLQVFDLLAACPDLAAFKSRHRDNPLANGLVRRFRPRLRVKLRQLKFKLSNEPWGFGFRWDAVRFAHKTFAIFHAARTSGADVLIWIDADTRFFADVDPARLETFVPEDRFVGYLARKKTQWSECGFVAYNLRHPATARMLEEFEHLYTKDELFREHEFHDSFLFDRVRRRAEKRGAASYDIAEGIGMKAKHVLINSQLGEFMDHMKGERKDNGKSHASDLIVNRPEAYWKNRDQGG